MLCSGGWGGQGGRVGAGRFETIAGILSSVYHCSGLSAKHCGPEISSLRRSWEEHPRAPGFLSRALDTASVKESPFLKGERDVKV